MEVTRSTMQGELQVTRAGKDGKRGMLLQKRSSWTCGSSVTAKGTGRRRTPEKVQGRDIMELRSQVDELKAIEVARHEGPQVHKLCQRGGFNSTAGGSAPIMQLDHWKSPRLRHRKMPP